MQRLVMMILFVTGCVLDAPTEATIGQQFQTCCNDFSCWQQSLPCGSGGGGGDGGGGSCDAIDCSTDWQCQQACLTYNAVCIVIGNGPYVTGSCWP